MKEIHPTWLPIFADPARLTTLALLHRCGIASVRDLATHAHTSTRTLRRHLDALVAVGVARAIQDENGQIRSGRPPTCYLVDPEVHGILDELFALLARPLRP